MFNAVMNPPFLGCIADDFTGATDLANNLVRAGMRVVQTIGVPDAPLAGEADAIVVALKSRTIAPADAIAQSLEAMKWLQAQGVARFEGYNHLYFESSALTYEAAIEGHGIAMGQLSFVQRELADGRLVRPFDSVLDTGPFTYYLTYPAKGRLGADKADFRNWLIAASHEPAV